MLTTYCLVLLLLLVLLNGITQSAAFWDLILPGNIMFLRLMHVVAAAGAVVFSLLYNTPWHEDITICWFILLLADMWVVSRIQLWEHSWPWCNSPRKAHRRENRFGRGSESRVGHAQAWVEVSAGHELIGFLQTTSHGLTWARVHRLSSLAAKVSDLEIVSSSSTLHLAHLQGGKSRGYEGSSSSTFQPLCH